MLTPCNPFVLVAFCALTTLPAEQVNLPGVPLEAYYDAGIALEILSPGEWFYQAIDDDFWGEEYYLYGYANTIFKNEKERTRLIDFLARRQEEMKDFPWSCDHLRFPSYETIVELYQFQTKQIALIEKWQKTGIRGSINTTSLQAALEEFKAIYEIYFVLMTTKMSPADTVYIRQRLAKLRDETLGAEAYYAGGLPPAAPAWFFRRID